jgi:hypothetical protein
LTESIQTYLNNRKIILFILGWPRTTSPYRPRQPNPPPTCASIAPPDRQPHPPLSGHCQRRSPTIHSRRLGPSFPFSSMHSSPPASPLGRAEQTPTPLSLPWLKPLSPQSAVMTRHTLAMPFCRFRAHSTVTPHRILGRTPPPRHCSVSTALLWSFSKI